MKLTRLLAIAILTAPFAGCDCGRPAAECQPEVTIVSPEDGQVFTSDLDTDLERAGVQVQVEATAASCMAELSTASLFVNDDANTSKTAFLIQGQPLRFDGVTLVPRDVDGTVRLRLVVEDADNGRQAEDALVVTLQGTPPVDCQFLRPLADETLTEADDADPAAAGFQYDVVIQCAGDLTGTLANLAIDGVAVPSAVFEGDTVTFAAARLNEGPNILAGRVMTEAGLWTGELEVLVDTPDCGVRLSPAGDLAFNVAGGIPRVPVSRAVADADGDAGNGIQVDVAATTADCVGGRAEFLLGGTVVSMTEVLGPTVAFGRLDIPDGSALEAWVRVTSDGSGPAGSSAPSRWWVDAVAPAPAVLFPTAGAILGTEADLDNDPSNGVQAQVYLEAPALETATDPAAPHAGALIEALLTRTDTGDVLDPVTCVVGLGGCAESGNPNRFRLPVSLEQVGAYELELRITDPAGNAGTTQTLAFSVDARPSAIAIDSPESGALVGTGSAGVSGSSVQLAVSGTNLPAGTPVTVTCTGAGGAATGTLDADGVGSVTVSFAGLPCDGAEVTCTPVASAEGTEIHGAPVTFRADLAAPTVAIVSPVDGASLADTAVTVEVVTQCLEEGQTVTVATDSGLTGASPASSGSAVVPLVLPAGAHVLTAQADDAAGNTGTSDPVSVSVDADPPQVVFVSPTAGLLLSAGDDADAATDGFQYDVVVQVPNKAAGAMVDLYVGHPDGTEVVWRAPLGPVATAAGNLRATFTGVNLPEGDLRLRADATSPSGLKGSAVIAARVDTGLPTCAVLSPADGAALGSAADANSDTSDGIQHAVRVGTDLPDGASVALTVQDAAGGSNLLTGTVTAGEAIFPDVTFLAASGGQVGENLLDAVCSDGAGGPAGAALQSRVRVDLEAPVAVVAAPADGAVINLETLDASAAEGFQVLFRGTASDASTGESVAIGAEGTLRVACGGAPEQVHTVFFGTFGAAVEARARATVVDQATCTFTFVVTDLAGNESAAAVATVRVDREAPVVGVVRPVAGATLGAADDLSAAAGLQRDVRVEYAGVEVGQSVRLFFSRVSEGGVEVESALSPHVVTAQTATGYTFARATLTPVEEDVVTVRVSVVDTAGNEAEGLVTAAVDLTAPQVAITRPAADRPCLNVFVDFDSATPGIQSQVDVATVGVSDGLPLRLCGTGQSGTACSGAGMFGIEERPVTGSIAVFPFLTFIEGNQELQAEVRDAAGNFNVSDRLAVCADSIPPSVTSALVEADTNDDDYINTAEDAAAGGTHCFTVVIDGAEGQTLRLTSSNPVAGTLVGTAQVVSGTAQVCGTLASGSHSLLARVTDENGNPNVNASNPTIVDPNAAFSVTRDITAPALGISSPAGSVLNYELDADKSTLAFDGAFAVTSDAEGATVTFSVDGSALGTATVSGGAASVPLVLQNGTREIAAAVSDSAGNTSTVTRTVLVDTERPVVSILSPADGALLASNTVDVQVQVDGAAPGRPLRVVRTDTSTEQILADVTVAAGQPQTVTVTLGDGTATLLARAIDGAGNLGESGAVGVSVDTVGCSLLFTAPSGDPVAFNTSSGTVTSNSLATTLVAHSSECPGLDVVLKRDGVIVATQTASAAGDASFDVILTHGEAGTFTAEIEDAFGNVTTTSFSFSVDLVLPVLTRTLPASASLAFVTADNPTVGTTVEGRLRLADKVPGAPAQADFTFEAADALGGSLSVELDGNALAGPIEVTSDPQTFVLVDLALPQDTDGVLTVTLTDAAGNLVELAHQVLVDVVAPAPPQLTLTLLDDRRATVQADWTGTGDDGSSGTAAEVEVRWRTSELVDEATWSSASMGATTGGAISTSELTPLPPLNTYWVGIRATDEVGNQSALVNGTSVATLDNNWSEHLIGGAGGLFGFTLLSDTVDLNNDGYDDLVIGAYNYNGPGTARGAAHIVYGGADLAALTSQVVVGSTDGERLGYAFSAGDVSGDGLPDLVVSSDGFTSGQGRTLLYFGVDSTTGSSVLDLGSPVEIRGTPATAGNFGRSLQVIDDVDGDGIGDLMISARAEAGVGMVYVFRGRSEAEWRADASVAGHLSTADSDYSFAGVDVDGNFGYRFGLTDIGDIDGDGKADLLVPAYLAGKLFVFRTSDFISAPMPVSAADAFQAVAVPDIGFDGFRFSADGAGLFTMQTSRLSSPPAAYLYRVSPVGLEVPAVQSLTRYDGAGGWGYSAAFGDITGDGLPDVAIGTNSSTTNRIHLYFNDGVAPYYRSSPPGSVVARPGYSGTAFFGTSLWIGDLNGDGKQDVAVGAAGDNGGGGYVYVLW